MKQQSGSYTSSMYCETCGNQQHSYSVCVCVVCVSTSPSRVFSILPFTILANSGSLSISSWAVMMGVLMTFEALMISFILGTPRVICVSLSQGEWGWI